MNLVQVRGIIFALVYHSPSLQDFLFLFLNDLLHLRELFPYGNFYLLFLLLSFLHELLHFSLQVVQRPVPLSVLKDEVFL